MDNLKYIIIMINLIEQKKQKNIMVMIKVFITIIIINLIEQKKWKNII